ncbi:ABC transporter ATP-binding protein [Spongiactinospora gelatinilytica]|uniref:ABC transporter ATP-binding protein n=1 Tax=Spongiactinospora gelatinilytica TaxID=2666298 RepID=A0A2W2H1Y2_9ACTN|nr:ATP-binding cassette domain-containing protein [Spongiactinospora gelatinilytica]PZG54561.1 ABC transporter ATP-binding protein [Spongiactinospora gelatinilytica]
MTAAVRCDGVVQIYKTRDLEIVALRDVDLVIAQGETVALLGPSGAGKSTLMWLMAGLLRPSAGRLRINGTDVSRLSPGALDRMRAADIGVVLQNPGRNLIPYATAAQNVAFAQRAARTDRRRAAALLDRVGLGGMRRRAGAMSGGEQQRLAVAVALANAPRLLLADEPTSQLDDDSGRAVIGLIEQAAEENGTTVVVVTHDAAVSRALGRTITIRDGKVGAEGRHGEEFVVVGREGGVQLPPEFHELLPPGSMARVEALPDGVALRRAES